MALSRPLMEERLPTGDAHYEDGEDYVIERPAQDGLPEVIWIVDDYDEDNPGNDVPIYISSDEEEEREFVDEGGLVAPLSSDIDDEEDEDGHQEVDTDEEDEDEEEEDSDDSDDGLFDWTSEDSGYESMYDDEEEDDDDDDDVRPPSPLDQQFPPDFYVQGRQQAISPVPAGAPVAGPVGVPQQPMVRPPLIPVQHQELPGQQVEHPEEGLPSVRRPEESAPSTLGTNPSTKRSREESCMDQENVKRQRLDGEEPGPSTSGLGFSTHRESAPPASGTFSFTKTRFWEDPLRYYRWDDDMDSD